jgi:hypothetical protein
MQQLFKRVGGLNGALEESMVVDRPSLQAAAVAFHHQDPDILMVKKVDFVAFIHMVINATAKVEGRSRTIEIIVEAAERFLGLKDFLAKELHGILPPSQALEPYHSLRP